MKTRLLLLASSAALAAGHPLLAATATHTSAPSAHEATAANSTSPAAPAGQTKLVLTVTVPPSTHPFRDDDVARAIADDVQVEFKRHGYAGAIDYDFSDPSRARAETPRLELNLTEWGVSPGHMIECTFTASLVTAQGTQDFGLFTGTQLVLSRMHDPFARADGFDDAARDAIDDLYRTLDTKGVVASALHVRHSHS